MQCNGTKLSSMRYILKMRVWHNKQKAAAIFTTASVLSAVEKEKNVSKQSTTLLQTADERYFKKEWYLPHVLFWGKFYRNHTVKICPYPKENMRKITFFFEGIHISFFFVNSQKCKKSPSLLVREHGTPILWASHISWLRYLSSMRKFPFGREVHYYMSSHATIIFANS